MARPQLIEFTRFTAYRRQTNLVEISAEPGEGLAACLRAPLLASVLACLRTISDLTRHTVVEADSLGWHVDFYCEMIMKANEMFRIPWEIYMVS